MKIQELQGKVRKGTITEKQKEIYSCIMTLTLIKSCADTGASAKYNTDDESNYDRAIEILLDSI